MTDKCSICGMESEIYKIDSKGLKYCKSCKATYFCSGCGKPFEYNDGDFICRNCGVVI